MMTHVQSKRALPMSSAANGGGPRAARSNPAASPADLVAESLRAAHQQLAQAREDLKAARRRVTQLEEVVGSWSKLAQEIDSANSTR